MQVVIHHNQVVLHHTQVVIYPSQVVKRGTHNMDIQYLPPIAPLKGCRVDEQGKPCLICLIFILLHVFKDSFAYVAFSNDASHKHNDNCSRVNGSQHRCVLIRRCCLWLIWRNLPLLPTPDFCRLKSFTISLKTFWQQMYFLLNCKHSEKSPEMAK